MDNNVTDVPIIKLFTYQRNYFVYDTYSNQLLNITKEQFAELSQLCEIGISNYTGLGKSSRSYNDILSLIRKGLFRSSFIEKIEHLENDNIQYLIDRCIQDITLQVTRDCNFKCRYCLFAHDGGIERGHEKLNMPWHIAKKSIDFLYDHAADTELVTIAFYGGEPLLNFELIKKVVEYAESIFLLKKIRYVMTINGSILSDEIMSFLVENNFVLAVSLDGPERIQNHHRIFISSGKGTFETVFNNIMRLKEKYEDYFNTNVSFVPVIFNDENQEVLLNEFRKMGISENRVQCHHADLRGIDYDLNYSTLPLDDGSSDISPSYKELTIRLQNAFQDKNIIPNVWQHNGPCIAGVSRLFVSADGFFYPCERVISNISLSIGDIENGLDLSKIIEFSNLGQLTENECKSCWAMRFCNICIANCFDIEQNQITAEQKSKQCEWNKHNALSYLKKCVVNK